MKGIGHGRGEGGRAATRSRTKQQYGQKGHKERSPQKVMNAEVCDCLLLAPRSTIRGVPPQRLYGVVPEHKGTAVLQHILVWDGNVHCRVHKIQSFGHMSRKHPYSMCL